MDSPKRLQLRVAAATEKDTVLGLFIESTLMRMGALHGAAEAEALRAEVFGKRTVVSFFRYPVADLLRLVDLSNKRGKAGDYGQGVVEFGRAAVRTFFGSPVGKTMSLLAGSDAHRLLSSAPSAYSAVMSFGERAYENLGPRTARMRFQGDLIGPGWQSGVVAQALEVVAGATPRLTVDVQDAAAATFVIHADW
jgi:uncharacterized protein (TIGR02265 family)